MEDIFCYGLDLNWDAALISRFNTKTKEPEPVCFGKDEQELSMPVVLSRRNSDGEWLSGQEALRAAARGDAVQAGDLLRRLSEDTGIAVGSETYRADFLMEEYLRRIVSMIREPGGGRITLLAVTLPEGAAGLARTLAGIFSRLGVSREQLMFLSHTECFMRYIVNMKPELRMNDAALFECSREHFYFDRVSFSKKQEPQAVISERKDFTDEYYGGRIDREEAERKAYWFYSMAQQQLSSRPAASVFVTGEGFSDGWAMEALKKLCEERRVFYGQNLFVRGACYAAYMQLNSREYIFLNENMTREDIMVKAYHDANEQYFVLSEAGSDYRCVRRTLRLILDDTDEIEFFVNHAMRREPVHEVMILDHLMQRENKTVRLELRLFYADRDTPVVQLRDIGFGKEKTTHRIWEQIL